jgi:hypothetical protein
MSRGQRIGLLVAAVAIAVVAFVIAKPGSSDNNNDSTSTQAAGGGSKPAGPKTFRIVLKNHEVASGPKVITVKNGDSAVIVVSSDKPETVHLHGFEIEHEITPSKPGRYAFKAKNEGAYELESHTTEKKLATVQVQPR